MTLLDHALVLAMLGYSLAEDRWLYPALVRAMAANVQGIRIRAYARYMAVFWTYVACVVALWIAYRRPWAALYLGPVDPLRVGLGLLLPIIYVALVWLQIRAMSRRPDAMQRLRGQLGNLPPFLPRTAQDRRIFILVVLTAGVCEEVIYRGFLIWYLATLTNLIVAVILSTVLFGLGHTYLGRAYAIRAGVVGAFMVAIVFATGSLWPAIVLHAVLDGVAGELAFRTQPHSENPHT